MTRYFFDLDDGMTYVRDEIGLECSSLRQVRDAAIAALPEIATEELPDGDRREFAVRVRDRSGMHLFEARLSFQARWLVSTSN